LEFAEQSESCINFIKARKIIINIFYIGARQLEKKAFFAMSVLDLATYIEYKLSFLDTSLNVSLTVVLNCP
jgi:hypothetical protein